MSTEILPQQFRAADGVEDWRLLFDGAKAFYRTRSMAEGAALVGTIPALDGMADIEAAVDLRADGVIVRLSWYSGITDQHVSLAQQVSAAAREAGAEASAEADSPAPTAALTRTGTSYRTLQTTLEGAASGTCLSGVLLAERVRRKDEPQVSAGSCPPGGVSTNCGVDGLGLPKTTIRRHPLPCDLSTFPEASDRRGRCVGGVNVEHAQRSEHERRGPRQARETLASEEGHTPSTLDISNIDPATITCIMPLRGRRYSPTLLPCGENSTGGAHCGTRPFVVKVSVQSPALPCGSQGMCIWPTRLTHLR